MEISQKPFSKRILEVITLSTLHVVKSPGLQRAPENLVLAPSVLVLYVLWYERNVSGSYLTFPQLHTWISRIYHFHAVCIFFLYDSIIRSLLSYTPFSKSWLKNFIYTNGWKSNSFPTMKRSGLVMDFGLLGIGKKCAFEVTFIESHTLFSFCQQIPKKVLHTVFISDWGRNYGHLHCMAANQIPVRNF